MEKLMKKYLSEGSGWEDRGSPFPKYGKRGYEDFYAERQNLGQILIDLGERLHQVNLPDPDSDSYKRRRVPARKYLDDLTDAVNTYSQAIDKIIKKLDMV